MLSWYQVKIYKVMIDESLFILVVQLHVAFVALPESARVERDFGHHMARLMENTRIKFRIIKGGRREDSSRQWSHLRLSF
jgi:hypothetical protein